MTINLIEFYKKRIDYWTFTTEHPVETRLRMIRHYSELIAEAQCKS